MAFINSLLDCLGKEWDLFGRDVGTSDKYVSVSGVNRRKETVQPYNDRVADYWMSISDAEYNRLLKAFKPANGRLDGGLNIAWSAAFISYCMQTAGAGTEFPYSAGHATWIIKSIQNRRANRLSAPIVGYRPGEMVVALGDLVGSPRGAGGAGVTYDNAPGKGWFESHTDIVVEVDTSGQKFFTIGGNVGQSVGRKEYRIDGEGRIASGSGLMVHIVNNMTGKIATASANALAPQVG